MVRRTFRAHAPLAVSPPCPACTATREHAPTCRIATARAHDLNSALDAVLSPPDRREDPTP